MLGLCALEMALSTQKVGSLQKRELFSQRQVVAMSRAWSSFPEGSPSRLWGSLHRFSNI